MSWKKRLLDRKPYTTPQYIPTDKFNHRMAHTITGNKRLINRIRRIRGQADALEKALEAKADCLAVLQQIAAIRGAVNGLMTEALEGHVREHLGAEGLTPAQRQDEVDSLLGVLRSYLK